MTEERRRPMRPSEWVTFAVAATIVLGVVVAILTQVGSSVPPAPVAEIGAVEQRGDRYVVPVAVSNEGDETAENVQVTATLTIEGEDVTSDQVIDFLAGGEEDDLEFVFDDDPADGELVVEIGGYALP